MADSITFTLINQPDAARILDEFEEQTGLEAEESDEDTRVYPLEGEDHQIAIVQTLTEIDEDWSDHLALQSPA
jgi:hypothetical protein